MAKKKDKISTSKPLILEALAPRNENKKVIYLIRGFRDYRDKQVDPDLNICYSLDGITPEDRTNLINKHNNLIRAFVEKCGKSNYVVEFSTKSLD